MIDLHYWPTPNGWKVSIMLEECGLDYEVRPVNIGRGDQFAPEFLAISPNNRMPAIVDHDVPGGPVSVFESGAILIYLAEKTGQFMPADVRGRFDCLQWLFWQVAGLGPMAGQLGHFKNYAEERIDYAVERYASEYNRLLGVLDRCLADRALDKHAPDSHKFMAGDYSIADMATWPWVRAHDGYDQSLDEFPHVARWLDAVGTRPAVARGFAIGADWWTRGSLDEEARRNLFGQTSGRVDELASQAADGDD